MAEEASLLLCSGVPVSVAEYASISLNMTKYPWKCLKNCSDYARALNMPDYLSDMFDRLFKMPWVLNKPVFWLWHSCICKGYTKFWICLIMAPYTSIMPEHASICNAPQYAWTWLNISECCWKYLNKLLWLCQFFHNAVI